MIEPVTLVALLVAGGFAGGLSGLLGIGGGTLSGPVLALLGQPLGRVVGAGAVFNIAVALPATLVFGLAGQVALLQLLALTAPAMLVAPWAARLAPACASRCCAGCSRA